jgi:hypothetical protein
LLGDIEGVACNTAASVRESEEWAVIVNAAEENGASYYIVSAETFILVPCMALIQ